MSSKANATRRDAWTAAQVAKAVRFTACMYRGFPEGYDKREAATLPEARDVAQEMLREYAGRNYGRGVMLYAITPDNLSIHVENVNP